MTFVGARASQMTAWLQCLAAAALFGATTPILKAIVPSDSPLWAAALLYIGAAGAAGATLFIVPGVLGQPQARLGARTLGQLTLAVVLGGCIGPVLLLLALARAAAADVSLWLGMETVLTAVLAHFLFKEHVSRKGWVALGMVVAAGALVAGRSSAGTLPAFLVCGACLCWAIDNNLSASLSEVSPRRLVLLKGATAGLVNGGLAAVTGGSIPGPAVGVMLLGVGALGYGASLVLYLRGARQLGAARSQSIFASAPLVGVALAWAFLGEPVEIVQLAAVAVFLGGLWLLISDTHAHSHSHEAVVHTHEHRHDDGHHRHSHPGLPPGATHIHEHEHAESSHAHPHLPDVHHRHLHGRE